MTGRRALVAGLALVIIAALAAAWMLVGPGRGAQAPGDSDQRAALAPDGSPLDFAGAEPPGPSSDERLADPAAEGGDKQAGTGGRDDDQPQPRGSLAEQFAGLLDDQTSSLAPAESGGSTAPAPEEPSPPAVLPRSARDPTAREAAARARYRDPASLPRAASLPPTAKTDSELSPLDMTKLAEPEIWAEYWSREGYTPPAMVKTPVRGKVMSLLTNTQVPGAKARIFTFFPVAGLGGPLLPVAMECVADPDGFFTCTLPTPERWPSDYPQYALSFEFEDRRIVDCAPFSNLRNGEHNEIGVFWAPEEPYELEVLAVTPEQGLTVAATGRIDPRRWETARAKSIFPLFGPTPLSAASSKLIGTWDIINEPPFVTLLRSGLPVLTRQCARTAEELVRAAIDSTRTSLFYEEATLDEVLYQLGNKAGVSITHTAEVDGEQPITHDVAGLSVRQALDLIAADVELSWRIEGSKVVFDVAGKVGEELSIGMPFAPVVFANDGKLTLSGSVVDASGAGVEGAVLTLTMHSEPLIAYSDSTGWFSFAGLAEKPLDLAVTHDRFVPRTLNATPGTVDMKVELLHRRPKATLVVTNAETGAPITEIWIGGVVLPNAYEPATFGNMVTMEPLHLTAADGRYVFESEFALSELYVQAHGYRFVGLTNEEVQGDVDVSMSPGVKLERQPRNYDAAQTPELFQTDEGEGPGLWSLDDDHWVEYTFDLGNDVTRLDLLLGVTNYTYGTLPLDNEYLFDVDVWVDGTKRGRMQIGSDPNVQQIGRLRLGGLTGQVTIRLMWMNDRYIPGQLDANIRYQSIRLMEVP